MTFAHRPPLAPIVALALCLGAAPVGYQLSWTPEEGSQLERRLELELEIGFRSAGVEAMGETLPIEEIYDDFDAEATERNLDIEAVGVDTIQKVELDQVLVLDRIYESVVVDGIPDDEGPSSVRFAWDRRRGKFVTEVLDDEVEEDEREAVERVLREDLDCRWLLPVGEVEHASEWQHEMTPQQALELVGIPGMDVVELFKIGMQQDTEDPELVAAFEPVLASLGRGRRAGTVDAKLIGTRVEDEQTIALVELAVEVELHLDISEFMVAAFEQEAARGRAEEALPDHVQAMILISGEGEGQFEWNVSAGRLHQLETAVDYVFEINGGFELAVEGTTMPFSGWSSWAGELISRRTVTER